MEEVYCEYCRGFKKYIVEKKQKKEIIDGKEIEYKGKEAVCSSCGGLVYVPEVYEYNKKKIQEKGKRFWYESIGFCHKDK